MQTANESLSISISHYPRAERLLGHHRRTRLEHNSRRGRQRLVSICDFVVALQSNRKWNVRNIKSFFCGFHLRRIGRCRCDVECGRYGDCCADAAGVYDIEARSSLTSSQWTCLPLTTESDRRYRSDQNVSFRVHHHLFLFIYLFTLTRGGKGVVFILPFRFSCTSGRCKQTFVDAIFCVNFFEESWLLALSDPVSYIFYGLYPQTVFPR